MTRTVVGDLVQGQVLLLSGVLVCAALRPDGLAANDGLSYYGVHAGTAGPYAVAIVGSALFTCRALRAMAPALPAPAYLRRLAAWLLAMSVGVVLTPYSLNAVFDWLHTMLGAAVFFLQMVLAVQMFAWSGRDGWIACFLAAQFVAGVVAAIFVLPEHGVLIQAQLVFQLAFTAVQVRAARLFVRAPDSVTGLLGGAEPSAPGDGRS